jgi:hypothetical protein
MVNKRRNIMVKYSCDICKREDCQAIEIHVAKEMLESFKEILGEYGLYKVISNYFVDHRINHVCNECNDKIYTGIYKHYKDIFDSFFEDSKPNPTVNIEEVMEHICKQLKLKSCK